MKKSLLTLTLISLAAGETNLVVSDIKIDPLDTNRVTATVTIPMGTNKMMFFRLVEMPKAPQGLHIVESSQTPHRSSMTPVVIPAKKVQ